MLKECGWVCLCLSVWAIVQISIMGVMYRIEATSMVDDAMPEHFDDVHDFLEKTKENFKICSRNCFIAVVIYVLILLSSLACIIKGNKIEQKKQLALLDDDFACTVEEKELTEKQKKKIK